MRQSPQVIIPLPCHRRTAWEQKALSSSCGRRNRFICFALKAQQRAGYETMPR